jgi:hypothetical protein
MLQEMDFILRDRVRADSTIHHPSHEQHFRAAGEEAVAKRFGGSTLIF